MGFPALVPSSKSGLSGVHLEVIPFLSKNSKTSSLVRSNGDVFGVDSVTGKHLVICCVYLPVNPDSLVADCLRSMITAYADFKTSGHVVEMVLITKLKPGFALDDDKPAFDRFFSEFACLAVPFSEFDTRDYIFSFIASKFSDDDISTAVVDPTGIILQHPDAHQHFLNYGSEWFPFLDSNVKALQTQDEVLRIRLDPFYEKRANNLSKTVMEDPLLRTPLSLEEDIFPTSYVSHLWSSSYASRAPYDKYLTESHLNKMYVGLYLFVDGEFMEQLNEVHQHCIANNQELQIVLVCLSLFGDQKSHMENSARALELLNITSWFVFACDSMVCRRLWRVFGQNCDTDKLIILPPYCKSGELEGRAVITQLGMKEYPFTRSSILERRLSQLSSLTPALWFNGTRNLRTCLYCNGRKSTLRQNEIQGSKLLLYLDWLGFSDDDGELCLLLMKHYRKFLIKGWKVVFVPLDNEDITPNHAIFSKMPWPIMPLSAVIKYSVINQLLLPEVARHNKVIAVNRNGRVLSRTVGERLKEKGFSKSLFKDKLRKEIAAPLLALLTDQYY